MKRALVAVCALSLHTASFATAATTPATDTAVAEAMESAGRAAAAGDCNAAVGFYTTALDRAPQLLPARYARAACREKLGDLAAAGQDYRSLVERYPAESKAFGNFGWVQFELGRFDEARQLTARAQYLAPTEWVWTANLAAAYFAQGDVRSAHHWYREALRLIPDEGEFEHGPLADLQVYRQLGGSEAAVAAMRNWLKSQYPHYQSYRAAWSQWRQSLELLDRRQYDQALVAAEKTQRLLADLFGPDHRLLALTSTQLGALYDELHEDKRAAAAFERALAIDEHALGKEHPLTATSLTRLGLTYDRLGRFSRAEQAHRRALAINNASAGPRSPAAAASLNNLALVYQHTGAYAMAESLDDQALTIKEATLGPGHRDTLVSLNNLASVYDDIGSYALAEQLYQRELTSVERVFGPDDLRTASSLNNLAHLYVRMGAYERAEPLYQRALALRTHYAGAEHSDTAASLNNLAQLYDDMEAYDKAEPLFRQALDITEAAHPPDAVELATILDNLASLYHDTHRNAEAEPLYRRALALREDVFGRDRPGTELSLNNLARFYYTSGAYDRAGPLYRRALPIALQTGDAQVQARILSNMADLYAAQHQPQLAIFWGKQAVNTLQGMRVSMRTLDPSMRDAFLRFNNRSYAHLADRLIEAGRLPEAQQVLTMQKEREYTDFVRGDDRPDQVSQAGMTIDEKALDSTYRTAGAALRTPEGGGRGASQADYEAFQRALEQIRQEIEPLPPEHRALLQSRNLGTSRLDLLSELNAKSGGGVVLLQYVVLEDSLWILMTSGTDQKSFNVPVGETDINRAVQDLLSALRNRLADPQPAAQRLYDYLLKPVAQDLEAHQTRTLMLSLDGTLRYLPFAALHDGKHYVVERYATTIFNEAAPERLMHDRLPHWQAAGLGLTEGRADGFSPLPGVRLELERIVHQSGKSGGILDGVVYLDAAFTENALVDALSAGYPVLHVASHFHFSPAGGEGDSFLVLGDGNELTLADLRHRYRLPNVDLLALSACDTAVGSGWGRNQNGHEVEGMATEAQNLGAMSVLASMWPVADESTALIMEAFYAGHEHSNLNKAEALRQAQRLIMQSPGTTQENERGARRVPAEHGATDQIHRFADDATHPFAHPYFWAPFVLMGNWL